MKIFVILLLFTIFQTQAFEVTNKPFDMTLTDDKCYFKLESFRGEMKVLKSVSLSVNNEGFVVDDQGFYIRWYKVPMGAKTISVTNDGIVEYTIKDPNQLIFLMKLQFVDKNLNKINGQECNLVHGAYQKR